MSWQDTDREDTTIYKVVINHEEQYSIWPANRENPLGWLDAGKSGPKDECLAHIKEVWTDMRPLSLRKQMEQAARNGASEPVDDSPGGQPEESAVEDLVDRLSKGNHPVEVSLRPERNLRSFKESIDRGYVHIRFTGTRGGTELGVRLDREAGETRQADFTGETGTVHLVGDLTLNYRKVRCLADIDLATLTGQGRLEPV